MHESLGQAGKVVSGEVSCGEKSRVVQKQIDAVDEFLKFTYVENIYIDDDGLPNKDLPSPKARYFQARILELAHAN